jgi:hypothetical protein
VTVKQKKLVNVNELLTKHFGAGWKEKSEKFSLSYYKGLFERLPDIEDDEDNLEEEEDAASAYSSGDEAVV